MRRTYISPEFKYEPVFGTYNMEEESSFFGSKMLEIEDSILIGNESLVYYQNADREQLDLEKEYDFPIVIYDTESDKKNNHILEIDKFQSNFQRNKNSKWIMTINLKILLRNYLFATLKKNRTFEGVSNSMTLNRSVDSSIREYIDRNVVNRYKFNGVDLYIVPTDLLTLQKLKFQNTWDPTIVSEQYKFKKFSTVTDFKSEDVKLFFSQTLPAEQYSFRYYFNLKFNKL